MNERKLLNRKADGLHIAVATRLKNNTE